MANEFLQQCASNMSARSRVWGRPGLSLSIGRRQYLYHGTSTLYLQQILKQGLRPCCMTGAVLMTCLADRAEIAAHHAHCMAEMEEADPVVFKIPVQLLDFGAFTLEDKFVDLGPSAGRGLAAQAIMGTASWETYPWSWQMMLRVAGAVGYRKTIPVSVNDIMQGWQKAYPAR